MASSTPVQKLLTDPRLYEHRLVRVFAYLDLDRCVCQQLCEILFN